MVAGHLHMTSIPNGASAPGLEVLGPGEIFKVNHPLETHGKGGGNMSSCHTG